MKLETDEALKIHIEGLQATLTKRNARIAELEAKLAEPVDVPEKVDKMVKNAYKRGWQDCARLMMEATKDTAQVLSKIRKDAFNLYVEGEKL